MLKLARILLMCNFLVGEIWTLDLKVAVVEYSPFNYDQPVVPETRLMRNILKYEEFAKRKPNDYDLIVFPESTLYTGASYDIASDIFPYSTLIPEPGSDEVACEDTNYKFASFFKHLSCLSKELKKFMVINLVENVPCKGKEKCPDVGYDVYNTNVVFNGDGKVVVKYQKYNLFGEKYMSQPNKQLVTFDLKEGVKIGLMTCFDIIFKEPALKLVEKGVQVVAFPLKWYSEIPFLTALQSQQQWAYEMDVILLAAGGNNPQIGSGGTGIYKGREGFLSGAFKSENFSEVFYQDFTTSMVRSKTSVKTIDEVAKKMDTFYLLKDNLKSYSSKLLNPKERHVEAEVCNGKNPNRICCKFSVSTTLANDIYKDKKNHYQYHLVAFSGVRTFSGVASGGIETCAVVACKNKTLESCGERFTNYDTVSWPLTFTKIEVKAVFRKDDQRIQFPNSLLSNIHPLSVNESIWTTINGVDTVERKHILTKDQERLMTFGIFGRDFSRDGKDVTQEPGKVEEFEEIPEESDKNIPGQSGFVQPYCGVIVATCLFLLLYTFE